MTVRLQMFSRDARPEIRCLRRDRCHHLCIPFVALDGESQYAVKDKWMELHGCHLKVGWQRLAARLQKASFCCVVLQTDGKWAVLIDGAWGTGVCGNIFQQANFMNRQRNLRKKLPRLRHQPSIAWRTKRRYVLGDWTNTFRKTGELIFGTQKLVVA